VRKCDVSVLWFLMNKGEQSLLEVGGGIGFI